MTINTQQPIDITKAYGWPSFPCNPIPFATALADLVRDQGTDSIKSGDARRILWVLMAQSYGQMATIDLCKEWDKFYREDSTQ